MVTVSVITAVYNARDTVSQALQSLFTQSYPAIESIVIDGASSDGTLQVLEALRPRLSVLVSEPDMGIYDALNKGIRRASGDVVGFLHADDEYAHPRAIAHVAAAFEDSAVDAVYGNLVYVRRDDTSKVLRYWRAGSFSSRALRRGWMPPHPTFFVRREIYERLGDFDIQFRIAADYDSILRFLARGDVRVHYLDEVLVRMRLGGASNRSLSNILRKSREDYLAVRRNGVGGAFTVVMKNFSKLHQFWNRG